MKTIKKRRKENKTDYGKRIKLLKSEKPRIVFRKTNRYILAQYVTSKDAQDKVELGITSKILLNYGWPKEAENSLKSVPASYFTGMLIGRKIQKMEKESPIADFGMIPSLHKSRVFAFLKGLIDSGIKIECKKEAFPDEKRIEGKDMKNKIPFNEIKSRIEKE